MCRGMSNGNLVHCTGGTRLSSTIWAKPSGPPRFGAKLRGVCPQMVPNFRAATSVLEPTKRQGHPAAANRTGRTDKPVQVEAPSQTPRS